MKGQGRCRGGPGWASLGSDQPSKGKPGRPVKGWAAAGGSGRRGSLRPGQASEGKFLIKKIKKNSGRCGLLTVVVSSGSWMAGPSSGAVFLDGDARALEVGLYGRVGSGAPNSGVHGPYLALGAEVCGGGVSIPLGPPIPGGGASRGRPGGRGATSHGGGVGAARAWGACARGGEARGSGS